MNILSADVRSAKVYNQDFSVAVVGTDKQKPLIEYAFERWVG